MTSWARSPNEVACPAPHTLAAAVRLGTRRGPLADPLTAAGLAILQRHPPGEAVPAESAEVAGNHGRLRSDRAGLPGIEVLPSHRRPGIRHSLQGHRLF